MLIGRGRRREHLIYENKREGVVSYGYWTRTYYKTPLFLQSDWIICRKWRLLIGSISSDRIGWYYKTFQSSFGLNKFILGPFRSRMRAPHPSRGSLSGDV